MRAGFERDDERGPAGLVAGVGEGRHLGVGAAEFGVPPLADRLPLGQHDRAHQRIGSHPTPAPPGEFERAAHRGPIVHGARPIAGCEHGAHANRTPVGPRRTSPITQVATPSAAAAAWRGATSAAGSAAINPTPRLKTSRISSVETPPAFCSVANSGGSGQLSVAHDRLAAGREHPHQVAGDSAAGDVGQSVHGPPAPGVTARE